ncbi:MAG: hypothetical protein EON92_19500 [Burkholderiales bacterium]|nr:MAG: hypothetical protein EON92_19500 [Burkholderiales bacterium]
MTMAILSQNLLYSQELTHKAACAERHMLNNPAADTAWNRAQVADVYAMAQQAAGAFAVFADFHPAANDEASEIA